MRTEVPYVVLALLLASLMVSCRTTRYDSLIKQQDEKIEALTQAQALLSEEIAKTADPDPELLEAIVEVENQLEAAKKTRDELVAISYTEPAMEWVSLGKSVLLGLLGLSVGGSVVRKTVS